MRGQFRSLIPNAPRGTATITVTANDGQAANHTFSRTFSITMNGTPLANAGVDQEVIDGDLVTLDGTASSDPEGDTLNFFWIQIEGPPATLTGANTANPTFTAPFVGISEASLTFQLMVSDSGGLSSTDTINVRVVSTTLVLDHFKCYKAVPAKAPKRQPAFPKFGPRQVKLEDQFESKFTDVLKPIGICNPADKNNEGRVDLDTHLEAYQIRDSKEPPQAKFSKPRHTVVNQFGRLVVDTTVVDHLLVPTTKSLTALPETPPKPENVDHYKCYTVKVAKAPKGQPPFPVFTPLEVGLEDQFGSMRVTVTRPLRLCNPVIKEVEGVGVEEIKNPANHLMCYQIAAVKEPSQPKFAKTRVFLNNQFGPEVLNATAIDSLCVPSLKYPPP